MLAYVIAKETARTLYTRRGTVGPTMQAHQSGQLKRHRRAHQIVSAAAGARIHRQRLGRAAAVVPSLTEAPLDGDRPWPAVALRMLLEDAVRQVRRDHTQLHTARVSASLRAGMASDASPHHTHDAADEIAAVNLTGAAAVHDWLVSTVHDKVWGAQQPLRSHRQQ